MIAEFLGGASVTDEFLDRWRTPGDRRSRTWEERFGETRYVPLGADAWQSGLKAAGVTAEDVDRVVVTGMHGRAARALGRRLGVREGALADDLSTTVGQTGAAHAVLILAALLEQSAPGEVVAVVSLADGADVLVFRTTAALAGARDILAERISDLLRAAAYETRVELQHHILSVEIAPDLPLVRMDYQLTLHALTNLLSNAARHTPENTEIRLLAHAEEASLVLAVEDDGPGIPPELLGSLFKKFSRAAQARPGGVGLGLSLVKGFVEAQGGEASAANRSGGGAVFSIRLPLLAEQSLALKGAAV